MSETQFIFPNYPESILSLSNSFLKHYGVPTDFDTLPLLDKALSKAPRNILFMIFDGMGTAILEKKLPADSFLRKHIKQTIHSVFPPTTTAATTTFYSALPPSAHGWLGWAPFFKEQHTAIELFLGTDFYTHEKIQDFKVENVLSYEHIFNHIKKHSKNVKTTEIFPKNIKENGVSSLAEMEQRVLSLHQENGEHFTLCYWPEPDFTLHRFGVSGDEVLPVLNEIDSLLQRLSKELSDTLIVVSADHGLIDVEEVLYIDDYPDAFACLSKPLSLDDRTSAVFLKPDKKEDFLKAFKRHFQNDFLLLSREEVFKLSLFGSTVFNERAKDFIGDYLIISVKGKTLHQKLPDGSLPIEFKGSHAGLTPDEIHVPLIII
jgi:predicted AlkP superfamily pyrophosphatase or phosphodiesterase